MVFGTSVNQRFFKCAKITQKIFLFDNIELLDFAGPYEVFSVSSQLSEDKLLNVLTISEDGESIKSINGLTIIPDFSIDDHPPINILIIPGGEGTKAVIKKPEILDWVSKVYAGSKITMSVCSGARIPGILGLLDNLESTTHHEVFEDLRKRVPLTTINQEKRFIDNGKIMTAGGISAGIDLFLHVVNKLCGDEIVDNTIRYMEYG